MLPSFISMLISPLMWEVNGSRLSALCHTRKTRHIHRRRRPIVGLLQGVKTRKVLQKTVFVLQVIQPRTAPVTIFTIEINRANGPRSRLPRCQSACNLALRIIQKCLQRFDINTGGKTIESFTVQHPSRPDRDRGSLREGALFTKTRIPVETHLMSKVSLCRPADSRIAHRKTA